MRPILLASASPRRAEILRNAGIDFQVQPARVDETRLPGEGAVDYVRRLAQAKAFALEAGSGDMILAADTTVSLGEEILEKPRDAADARRMLDALAGRRHQVITAICLRVAGRFLVDHEVTDVSFLPLTEEEIAAYVASGEPMDKAGAYAIQGLASRFIDRVEGCYFNVVGLPVSRVWRGLKELSPEISS